MRYGMQYLKTENVHLIKDMGMIPYKLFKRHGFQSSVITYENGEYPYLNKEVRGLNINFAKKFFHSFSLDGAVYLIKHAKEYDIIQIFHTTLSSVIYAYIYKAFNPKGKIYLKLDCSHKLVERIRGLNALSYRFLNKFFSKIDLISVEQEALYPKIKELLPRQQHKIIKVSNGVDYDYIETLNLEYDFSKKENIILNVARIGAEEKNTSMLLEAFANIKDIEKTDWKLVLVGPVEKNFESYISDYFAKYPKIINKVIIKGNIDDRRELYMEYQRSKIFSLTSDFESFGIAFIEAAAFGDVIVATDVGIAKEIVGDNNGRLVPVGDVNTLTKALEESIYNLDLEYISNKTYELTKEKYDWNKIIDYLHEELVKI
ncbi:glycosyltransferase family 4 protein [Clostridium amazonitimonense]|uniref:glycosyltransferase family 4 protein n=1 Tax=Clostridium amazonitimonense TaxID=1499689 RepID=UPI000509D88E|nr:glycosyltransferase family 4 protein [Clostridium amazonitimonense]